MGPERKRKLPIAAGALAAVLLAVIIFLAARGCGGGEASGGGTDTTDTSSRATTATTGAIATNPTEEPGFVYLDVTPAEVTRGESVTFTARTRGDIVTVTLADSRPPASGDSEPIPDFTHTMLRGETHEGVTDWSLTVITEHTGLHIFAAAATAAGGQGTVTAGGEAAVDTYTVLPAADAEPGPLPLEISSFDVGQGLSDYDHDYEAGGDDLDIILTTPVLQMVAGSETGFEQAASISITCQDAVTSIGQTVDLMLIENMPSGYSLWRGSFAAPSAGSYEAWAIALGENGTEVTSHTVAFTID